MPDFFAAWNFIRRKLETARADCSSCKSYRVPSSGSVPLDFVPDNTWWTKSGHWWHRRKRRENVFFPSGVPWKPHSHIPPAEWCVYVRLSLTARHSASAFCVKFCCSRSRWIIVPISCASIKITFFLSGCFQYNTSGSVLQPTFRRVLLKKMNL